MAKGNPTEFKPLNELIKTSFSDVYYEIIAKINRNSKDDNGVIVSAGGNLGGYCLFIQNNKLKYHHNYFGEKGYRICYCKDLPLGDLEVGLKVTKTEGSYAIGKLFINEEEVAIGRIGPVYGELKLEQISIGLNEISAVTDEYKVPFKFKGEIISLKVDMKS